MRTGIGFPSYQGRMANLTGVGWKALYPLSNIADIIRIMPPARASADGARAISWTLSATSAIQFFALIGHNLTADDTFRVRVFSDTNPDPAGNAGAIVYDSGFVGAWPSGGPVAGYRSVRPLVFPSSVNGRSILLNITAAGTIELGAVDFGGWWELPGLGQQQERGFNDGASSIAFVGGAESQPDTATPRTISAQVDFYAASQLTARGLDFQKVMGQRQPFVWVQDYDAPSTWARTCMLVTNKALPAMVGALYKYDSFPLRLIEHIR